MVLEATCKVADTALAVASDVGNLADVVEHVAAREEEDGDQADGGPDIAVLDDGKNVGPGDKGDSDGSEGHSRASNPPHPVDRALNRRVRTIRDVSRDPSMNLLGSLGAEEC